MKRGYKYRIYPTDEQKQYIDSCINANVWFWNYALNKIDEHYKETKKGAYFEAGLNIVSSIILVQYIGIIGTAVGTLLANLFRTIQYSTYVSQKLIPRNNSIIVKRIIWTSLNVLLSDLICSRFVIAYASLSWTMWIVSGIGCVFVSLLVCLITSYFFYRSDIGGLINLMRRMLIRKRGR